MDFYLILVPVLFRVFRSPGRVLRTLQRPTEPTSVTTRICLVSNKSTFLYPRYKNMSVQLFENLYLDLNLITIIITDEGNSNSPVVQGPNRCHPEACNRQIQNKSILHPRGRCFCAPLNYQPNTLFLLEQGLYALALN